MLLYVLLVTIPVLLFGMVLIGFAAAMKRNQRKREWDSDLLR